MSATISNLPGASTGSLGDIAPVTQGSNGPGTGTTRKLTMQQLLNAGSALATLPTAFSSNTDTALVFRGNIAYQATIPTGGGGVTPPSAQLLGGTGSAFTELALDGQTLKLAGSTVSANVAGTAAALAAGDLSQVAASSAQALTARENLFSNADPSISGGTFALSSMRLGDLYDSTSWSQYSSGKLIVSTNSNAIVGVAINNFAAGSANQPCAIYGEAAIAAGSTGNLAYSVYGVVNLFDAGRGVALDAEPHNYAGPSSPILPPITSGAQHQSSGITSAAGGPFLSGTAYSIGFPGRGPAEWFYGTYARAGAIQLYASYYAGSYNNTAGTPNGTLWGHYLQLPTPPVTPNGTGTLSFVASAASNLSGAYPYTVYTNSPPAGLAIGQLVTGTNIKAGTFIADINGTQLFFGQGNVPGTVSAGQIVTGTNIPAGATVAVVDAIKSSFNLSAMPTGPIASGATIHVATTGAGVNLTTAQVTTPSISLSAIPTSPGVTSGETLTIGQTPYSFGYVVNPKAPLTIGDGTTTPDNSKAIMFGVVENLGGFTGGILRDGSFANDYLTIAGQAPTITADGGAALQLATSNGIGFHLLNPLNPAVNYLTVRGSAGNANVQVGYGGTGSGSIEVLSPTVFDSTVTLAAAPTTTLQAATKGYVDTAVAGAGSGVLPWVANRFYAPELAGVGVASTALAVGTLYASPVYIPAGTSITKIAFHQSAVNSAAYNAELGLYTDGGRVPGALVSGSDTGSIAIAASTAAGDQVFTYSSPIAITTGGWYWIAFQMSAAGASIVSINSSNGGAINTFIGGGSFATLATQTASGYSVSQTFGTLPGTFGGSPNVGVGPFAGLSSGSAAPAFTESLNDTEVYSPSTTITDAYGDTFALLAPTDGNPGYQISHAGTLDGTSHGVVLLMYYGHAVYQQNYNNAWYAWNHSSSTWTSSADPRPGINAPGQAVLAGYRTRTFGADNMGELSLVNGYSGTHDFYTSDPYSYMDGSTNWSVAGGVLTMNDQSSYTGFVSVNQNNGTRSGMPALSTPSSHAVNSGNGVNFRYGYFEASMAFPGATAGNNNGWAAFWLGDFADIINLRTSQSGYRYMELDIIELYPTGDNSKPDGITPTYTVHEWVRGNSQQGYSNQNSAPASVPAGYDPTQMHKYAALWTPGKIVWYLDDVAVVTVTLNTSQSVYEQYDTTPGNSATLVQNQNTPNFTYEVGQDSSSPSQQMYVQLGTGANKVTQFGHVCVWQ